MTDKANVTIPSPVSGQVLKLTGAEGELITVGQVCIEFEVEGEGNATSDDRESPADATSDEAEGAESAETVSSGSSDKNASKSKGKASTANTSQGRAGTAKTSKGKAITAKKSKSSTDSKKPAVRVTEESQPTAQQVSDSDDSHLSGKAESTADSATSAGSSRPSKVSKPASREPTARAADGRRLTSPSIRRRAKENEVDLADLVGTGPAGRITHDDLDAFITSGGKLAAVQGARIAMSGTVEIPVIGLRRIIAEKMSNSKTRIPHFSYFEEVDVTNLEALRQHLNANRSEGEPKLTYLPFIMQALVRARPIHPECFAHYDDEAGIVTQHEAVNLGIATQTDRGLYVPVVHHTEALDIWGTANELNRVATAARNNNAALEELRGSTFSITSLGRDGGLGATPIINHPEVAILGVHKAEPRAVVRDGNIVIRRMMNLSSSFDHRVVDGANGAALVQTLKKMLEHPATIFI
jgi:2-oxoisovalerate dehydrogenase E2 component (dihydrolipoyl transacylase)